jgi:methyl-accepting chemotaxis protein
MPDIAPIGYEELGAVALLQLANLAGSSSFCFPVATLLIASERTAFSNAITALRVQIPSARVSLGARLTASMLAYVVASGSLIAAAGWARHTSANRHDSVSELVAVALQDAYRVSTGGAPTHGRIVDLAQLPAVPVTTALDDHPPFEGMHIVVDRRQAHVHVAAPLADGRWLLVDGPVTGHSHAFELMLLVFGAVLVLWGTLTAIILTRSLIDPLVELERSMRRLVEVGDIREQAPLPVIQSDEIGRLTQCYNDLAASLRELADAAQVIARGQLMVTLDRPGDLHDAFRRMVEQLDGLIVQIRESAVDVSSTTAEIYAATQEQEAAAERNTSGVGQVRTTVASLAGSARDITRMANDVRDNAERSLAMTDVMTSKIGELSNQANGISELLEVIREVADRSDLLALNGSLEASRAGEVGRGFALVAAEMRRLAERVTQTVASVRTRVADIKTASAATVMATQDSRKLAQESAAAAQQIVTVTQRQFEDTSQAAEVVEAMADFVVAASAATTQTRAAAESLRGRAEALDRLTSPFAPARAGSGREDKDD